MSQATIPPQRTMPAARPEGVPMRASADVPWGPNWNSSAQSHLVAEECQYWWQGSASLLLCAVVKPERVERSAHAAQIGAEHD